MESLEVKELRAKYGVLDSRNEYTKEELLEIVKSEMYVIKCSYREEMDAENIVITYKKVPGYVSGDATSAVFIKNVALYGDNYMPVKRTCMCKEINGGYLDKLGMTIYCYESALKDCIEAMKEYVKEHLKERIAEVEEELRKLKNSNIKIKN